MNRLEPLDINALTPEQQAVLDAMQSGPRGARHGRLGLIGPFGVWVRSPIVGNAAQAFGAVVRFESQLPENVKEVSICTVGAHFHAKFEFAAHGPMAIAAGVSETAVEAIRRGEPPTLEDDGENLAYEIATALLTDHRMSDSLYSRARETFSENELIELVTIIGYYCLVSLTLNAFEIALPDTMKDPFPDES
ncbi:MAG: carboxymuconolactone decarboxylase family protein [Gammaproteobacteria bacterium]|nr:carboxymuconolactone decarboxylase family protein [Gammaproteobacteria bacterium]